MAAATAEAGTVTLDPNPAVISSAGNSIDIDVVYDSGGVDELAIDIVITYDQTIVTATNAVVASIPNCAPGANTGNPGEVILGLGCPAPLPDGVLFTITFQGVTTGVSPVAFDSCAIEEEPEDCAATDGTVEVQGDTPTPSPTLTNTATPTVTPTATDTSTVGPTATPTATPTVSPTGTTTNTPTVTPTGGQHTTGLTIDKNVPAAPQPQGSTIMITITLENEDDQHGINISSVTNQFPFPGGSTVQILNCDRDDGDGEFFLDKSDGIEGSGPDFTTCTAEETLDVPCTGATVPASDEVAAMGTDADPLLLASGGFGGLTVSSSTTNAVIVLCNTPTPTTTSTATPTSTPTQTPTATRTNTPGPTNTVPPIPVVPSPMSPAGMLMVGALGVALLLSLRRIAKI